MSNKEKLYIIYIYFIYLYKKIYMKILVTGGCGYVGSILIPKLLNKNHKVINIDNQWFGNYLKKHKNLLNLIQLYI